MKCALCLVTLFLVAALAYSYPAAESIQQQLDDAVLEQPAVEVHSARLKRDRICSVVLGGFPPGVNHRGCDRHCRSNGYKSGACEGEDCHCAQ
uniref:Putative defensin n=1 Tax=Panstrongylus lignarius TaxID=156445 RepID=A0A224XRJ1_9HEMI